MASNKRTGTFQATGGIVNTYKLLLGDRVIRDATKTLGKDGLKNFLRLQHRYDLLVTKNPALDPLRKLEVNDIPVFDGFESYVHWLGSIERTLKVLSNPIQKEMHKIVVELIGIGTPKPKQEEATKSEKAEAATVYELDGTVVVTARVKTASEYHWFKYTGKRSITIGHGNGKTTVTLNTNDVFGLRPSSNGKFYRLIAKNTGLTKVFTLDASTYKKLLTYGTGIRQPTSIQHSVSTASVSASDMPALASVTDAELAQAIAGVHFHSNHFVSSLNIPVRVGATSKLPASYPSFDKTFEVVTSVAGEKQYHLRLRDTLSDTLRQKVEALVVAMERQRGVRAKTVPEIVAEAHEYLIDHGWMQYDLENVAHASYNFAVAGVSHRVTTKGKLVEFEHPRTYAYAFLGVALESVLRKAVVSLVRDTVNGTVLAGYGAGFDVVCACASTWVQEQARMWLNDTATLIR
jgi:hypothetical protein